MTHSRHHLNVVGPFYVEDGCCTFCGVPAALAGGLFAEAQDSCFVQRQPEMQRETDRMLRTMITSETGCIRYAGDNAAIIRRLAEAGEPSLIDGGAPIGIVRRTRDHVGVRTADPSLLATSLMISFIAHVRAQPTPERYRIEPGPAGEDRCDLRLAWYQDRFHPVSFQRSPVAEFDWLIVGLETLVYDWLEATQLGEAVFFDGADWAASRTAGSSLPW